ISGRNVMGVVEFDQFAQERLGGFFVNGLRSWRCRGLVNALPIGDEAFAVTSPLAELLLPTPVADVGTAETAFLVKKQSVITFFIGERFLASLTGVGA